MSKPTKLQVALQTITPKSLRDAGALAARSGDSLYKVGQYCAAHMEGFPGKVSKDDWQAFKEGVFVHYQTVKPAEVYRREGVNLVKLDKDQVPAKLSPDMVKVDVAYATGISSHDLGKLKDSDRALYDVLNPYRQDCNAYASNAFGNVKRSYKATLNKSRSRGTTKPVKERMDEWFTAMATSIKTARDNRGDPTAPSDEAFKRAVKAFWTELSK